MGCFYYDSSRDYRSGSIFWNLAFWDFEDRLNELVKIGFSPDFDRELIEVDFVTL